MSYKNKERNLSRGIKPFQVKSKSDIKKYCFDHGIPAPKFSPHLERIFVDHPQMTYNQHQAMLEMADQIGYAISFVQSTQDAAF